MATANASSSLRAERLPVANGLSVLHNRAAANPSVVVRALIRAGASREASEDQGLAGLTGRMLRLGTEGIAKEALAEELDGMGAGLSVDVGYALVSASIKCLSADFSRAVEILGEVVRRPQFAENELERLRGQVLTELREMNDNTRFVAERTWRQMAYPEGHRYHQLPVGTAETINGFTTRDLAAFHSQWYGTSQTTLVVVGDVEADAARESAHKVFGDWHAGRSEPVQQTLPLSDFPRIERQDMPMEGKTQADVVIGTPTLDRQSPDFYALSFANHILGRMYFMGRFGEKVRDEQGLAYYAYSELGAGYGRGPWLIRAGVNPSNLDKALESIASELTRFLEGGPTEEEQTDAVASILGSLPRQLETNEGAAAVLAEMELYDLGLNFLERYPEIVRSLTREQVTETARTWLKPERLVTAIAGPPLG